MAPTRPQQDVRDEFIRVHGAGDDAWERILELDAGFLRAYLNWAAVPVRRGAHPG